MRQSDSLMLVASKEGCAATYSLEGFSLHLYSRTAVSRSPASRLRFFPDEWKWASLLVWPECGCPTPFCFAIEAQLGRMYTGISDLC